jgi:cell division protease FtsH
MNVSGEHMKEDRKFSFIDIVLWILLTLFLLRILTYLSPSEQIKKIPYNQFISLLEKKQINSVIIREEKIEGTLNDSPLGKANYFVTIKLDDPSLTQKLLDSGARFEAVNEHTIANALSYWVVPILFMYGVWWIIFKKIGNGFQGQFTALGKSKAKTYVEHDIKTTFADVAGVDEAKFELQEIVQFLKEPSKYTRLGGRMPKGILLVGPPGTGKTLLARAVAGEASVAFFSINGSEFVEMFVGVGAARVRNLFSEARENAPCIIFIDELDALGKTRGAGALSGSHEEKEQTLDQLLAELDGFDPSRGIVLLAATNRPETLDPALLRSGRFDRQIMLDKPDRKGRGDILKVHLKKIQISQEVDVDEIAGLTAGFSGADLANLVNEAALIATRREGARVEQNDFTNGIERLVAGLERKSRVLNNDEKKQIAYHEMGHTLVSLALEKNEAVHKVSIIPRGIGALGYTLRRPAEDRYLISKSELESKISVLLGGRAAETFFLSKISTGAADDFAKATDIARTMVTRYGMSDTLGLLSYDSEVVPLLNQRIFSRSHDYSEKTAETIDMETRKIMDRCFNVALDNIQQHRKFIEEAVVLLIEQETLDESNLKDLWSSNIKFSPN